MTPPLSLSELETQPGPPQPTSAAGSPPPPHFCSLPWEPLQGAVSGCSEQSPQTLSTNSQPGFTPEPTPRASSSPPTALAVGAVPVVLGALGFTGAGIAASSLAAKMMSAAAVANGGGVAAGSLVATLQSVAACRAGPWGFQDLEVGSLGLGAAEGPRPRHLPLCLFSDSRPGAAGLSTSSNILLGSVGSAFGAWLGGTKKADTLRRQVVGSELSEGSRSPGNTPGSPPFSVYGKMPIFSSSRRCYNLAAASWVPISEETRGSQHLHRDSHSQYEVLGASWPRHPTSPKLNLQVSARGGYLGVCLLL
uniref:Uncharacterized protein n=1 Tax=Sus scrofa TaxID=9823 RepID=A0A8D0ZEW3_PIG